MFGLVMAILIANPQAIAQMPTISVVVKDDAGVHRGGHIRCAACSCQRSRMCSSVGGRLRGGGHTGRADGDVSRRFIPMVITEFLQPRGAVAVSVNRSSVAFITAAPCVIIASIAVAASFGSRSESQTTVEEPSGFPNTCADEL